MKVRHQQRARRPSAPTDLQTEMSDDEGSGNGWSGARLTNATTAALVRTYRGTSFLPEDRRFKPLVLSLLRGTEGSNPCPSSEKSCQTVLPIPGVDGRTPGAAALGQLSPSRSLAHLGAVPDNRSLIQINPHILLLHCVHRSGRRPKDRSIWVNQYSAAEVQNVDIGRDHQGEAADQRSACARRHATREAR